MRHKRSIASNRSKRFASAFSNGRRLRPEGSGRRDDRAQTSLETEKPSWVRVRALPAKFLKEAAAWCQAGLLDAGEAEAIALARRMRADWFLTDDAAARLFAQSLGIEVHGSLGVALWAAAVGELDRSEAEAALDRLRSSSLWISAKVLAEARAALRQLYR